MEQEARFTIAHAPQGGDWASMADEAGLGSCLAALFAGQGFEEPIAAGTGGKISLPISARDSARHQRGNCRDAEPPGPSRGVLAQPIAS
jgi:hypothetical protein